MIVYRVDLEDRHAHAYAVTLRIDAPAADQVLSLPVWIPGSYLVREFARHLSGLVAQQGGRPVGLEQRDKTTWIARCSADAPLELRWRVYAFDTSVRTAFLDADRGFFNGTSLLLRVHGREQDTHRLQLGRLPAGWEIATAMAAVPGRARTFQAAGYDELVDHPVALGRFWRGAFDLAGATHELVVAGAAPGFDGERLLRDTQRLCAAAIAFWHGDEGAAPPFARYLFLLHAAEEGWGGLEHRASTALVAPRSDLPRVGEAVAGDGGVRLLGLISHEYFHAWNVKRLKPAEFAQLDYAQENYTRLLWFFEGFTSYFDDLLLRRAGLVDAERYLKLVAKSINDVAATPGRRVQSLAAASFDAWNKYYRPDENSPNSTVSYYQKGALVALALDLELRRVGGSLDGAMRALWRRSGGGPIDEAGIAQALAEQGGRSFAAELAAWVHGTDELPLASLLAESGVRWRAEPAPWAAALGLRMAEGGLRVRSVLAGSAAAAAGVSAGDELIAVDGWRLRRIEDAAAWVGRERPFELLLARDQRLRSLVIRPQPARELASVVSLAPDDGAPAEATRRRQAWLGA